VYEAELAAKGRSLTPVSMLLEDGWVYRIPHLPALPSLAFHGTASCQLETGFKPGWSWEKLTSTQVNHIQLRLKLAEKSAVSSF
jgi:hypothetical protein